MIEVSNLHKQYGVTTAVEDLSFVVRPGVVTGFLGPNGAGKSTTMRMVLGLDRPTRGTALVDGVEFRRQPAPLRSVGSLLDAAEIHPRRTAYAHLLALAVTIGAGRARVEEVLGLVGLQDVAGQRAGRFSLGMSQRLGLAGALIGDPATIILDEPINGLDPEGVLWMRQLLRSLAAEGRTVFLSSHLMSEMAQTADHLVVIGQGRLVADVATRELLAGTTPHLLIRSPRLELLEELLRSRGAVTTRDDGALLVESLDPGTVARLALDHDIPIHELTPRNRSLEEAFLDLTGGTVQFRTATQPHDREEVSA